MSAPRSPGRASSSTRTASGISYPSAVSLSPLLRACLRAAVLHRATCDPASSRPRVIHHKSPHDMPCSRRSPFKPLAGASTSMWDSSRVCRSQTTPCTKRYSATRSYRPRLSARRVDMVAALPATIPCLVRHLPCQQYAYLVIGGAPATRIYGRSAAGCGNGSCYSKSGWRTGCSPNRPRSARRSWYANIWMPMQGRYATQCHLPSPF